ncbi:MAG: DHHA1 domain-containing protein [Candidatus Acidiferrales bacterium]
MLYAILHDERKGTDLTDRLYYHDSFLREFDATVTSCEQEAGRWKVILDKTAFYPTSGGQPHDLGKLGEASVVEVIEEAATAESGTEKKVVHYTSAEVPLGPVHGVIDWARRIDHMQQHSAQHLLSAAFIELFGFKTISFHLGKEISTIDLETSAVVARHLDEAERRTNEIIFEDRPVVIRFGTAQELSDAGVRKKVEREGILRAIEIEGFDRQPCGGTHLARTGQAGLALIRKLERRRDLSRVEYVAGYRALAAARSDFAALTNVASQLSCALAEVPAGVSKILSERREQFSASKHMAERLATLEAQRLLQGSSESRPESVTDADGGEARVVATSVPEATAAYLGLLAARLAATASVVALLVASGSGQVVFAQSKGLHSDLGAILRECLRQFGGKGGGSKDYAQGNLPNPKDASAFLTRARELLNH